MHQIVFGKCIKHVGSTHQCNDLVMSFLYRLGLDVSFRRGENLDRNPIHVKLQTNSQVRLCSSCCPYLVICCLSYSHFDKTLNWLVSPCYGAMECDGHHGLWCHFQQEKHYDHTQINWYDIVRIPDLILTELNRLHCLIYHFMCNMPTCS